MFDISKSEFNAVRYEHYAFLLENEPVFWYEPMNSWMICGFDQIQEAIKSGNTTTSDLIQEKIKDCISELGSGTRSVLDVVQHWMIYNDGETHARLRKFMNQSFARKYIDQVLPNIKIFIRDRLETAILGHGDSVELDIVDTFAHPVPAEILKDMLGLDEISLSDFLRWSDSIAMFMQDFVVSPQPNNRIALQTAADMSEMIAAFEKSIQIRRSAPKNDLLSTLVLALESSPDQITERELCFQLIHLIFGGHKIPQFVIANTLNLLFQWPEVLREIQNGAVTIRDVVNESMRFEGPIQFITRHATKDFEMGGKKISTGDSIFLMLGAANRDPKVFADPDTFSPSMKRRNSLAFGMGAHTCIGAALVVAELEEILDALLNSDFDIKPLYNINEPDWTCNATFHGINKMPIILVRKVRKKVA